MTMQSKMARMGISRRCRFFFAGFLAGSGLTGGGVGTTGSGAAGTSSKISG